MQAVQIYYLSYYYQLFVLNFNTPAVKIPVAKKQKLTRNLS